MKLLHIDSSITGAASASRKLSAAIVARFRAEYPDLDVTYRDLVSEPLPHVTLAQLPSSHPLSQRDVSASEAEQRESDSTLAQFLAADVVVIGAPTYNFTVSSQLKAWIDRILVPGQTFSYTAQGVQGLARGKRVIVAVTSGADAPPAALEHVETYLRGVFAFIGVQAEFVVAQGLATARSEESLKHAANAANTFSVAAVA